MWYAQHDGGVVQTDMDFSSLELVALRLAAYPPLKQHLAADAGSVTALMRRLLAVPGTSMGQPTMGGTQQSMLWCHEDAFAAVLGAVLFFAGGGP